MSLEDPVVITCSISGAIADRDQCPAVPYTPEEYAAEARHGALQRRPDRQGAPDDAGRGPPPATVSEARELLSLPERELTRREVLKGEGS